MRKSFFSQLFVMCGVLLAASTLVFLPGCSGTSEEKKRSIMGK